MPEPRPTVDELRHEARAWLAAHLERRPPGEAAGRDSRTRGLVHVTHEHVAEQRALQRVLHDAGWTGISWPAEYGGRGLTAEHERAFDEEASLYVLPDLGIAGVVTRVVCANVVLAHASEDFKRRHLPRMLSGEELWVEFLSEPAAGSDLAGIRTTATRDGDAWVLDGRKIWSSGAYYADYGLCLARTDPDVPKHRGLTWFAVPVGAPGVTVSPLREITGDVEFCEELLEGVVVPDAERIGDVDAGWTVAQTVLFWEREASSGGTTSAPPPPPPGELAPDLVALARRVGRLDDHHVRQLIATAHVHDRALTQLGVRIAERLAAGDAAGPALVGYPKLGAGTFQPLRARIAMEIGAGAAVAWPADDPLGTTTALGYLNARVTSIAGGTNEVQRNAIGERVLGLPREPSSDRDRPFSELLRAEQEG